jgi:L-amino acid ligase C-terminal domain 2
VTGLEFDRVLLVNSYKRDPVPLLELDESIRLTVLTEPGYRKLYAPDTSVLLRPDLNDFKAAREAVMALMRSGPIDHIVAPSERSVLVSGYLRSLFGIHGIPFEVANRFSNKLMMKKALAAAGLPHVPFTPLYHISAVREAARKLGWPLIVKPAFGAGGEHTIVLKAADDYERGMHNNEYDWFDNCATALVAERYCDVKAEYHCDGIVIDGEAVFASVSRYFEPLFGRDEALTGSYILSESSSRQGEIIRLHALTVTALGLRDGVTHLEVLETGEGLFVGEIACRLGGVGVPHAIELQYGVDMWRAFLDISLSRKTELAPKCTPGIVIQVMLPAKPGVIRRLSSAEELGALPGVTEAEMSLAVGSHVPRSLHSSYVTGLVYARVPDEASVESFRSAVQNAYVVESDHPELTR